MNSRSLLPWCLGLAAITIWIAAGCAEGPEFSVINRTRDVLHEVGLEYSGGSVTLGQISPGTAKSVRITPRGESGLVLYFRTATGESHRAAIDVYFEGGYRGSLRLIVEADLRTRWEGTLKPGVI
jgi:hypothetical protein